MVPTSGRNVAPMWCVMVATLCAAVVVLLHVQPVYGQAVYVSDAYGNVVYDNGTVIFVRPLPVGTGSYKTSTEYDDLGLGVLFAFARSFINTVMSDPFPFGKWGASPLINIWEWSPTLSLH